VVRALVAESAARGWDDPRWWGTGVEAVLRSHHLTALARRVARSVGGASRWVPLGITAREADVLELVTEGLSNKDIAVRLGLSPRTVEKHVESLLRKLGARSRTHLAISAEARLRDDHEVSTT
jgi:DNA-binding NarL/FixJ family response regulator